MLNKQVSVCKLLLITNVSKSKVKGYHSKASNFFYKFEICLCVKFAYFL
jgi:hypothetical protein